MKHLSLKQKRRLLRLARYRKHRDNICRRLRLAEKKKREQYGIIRLIKAPVVFSLGGYSAVLLLDFIRKLDQAAKSISCGRVEIDFMPTERMVSDGTLYFWAYLETLRSRYPKISWGMRQPSDEIVRQVLYQVGIARLLGQKFGGDRAQFHSSVKGWHAASGKKVNAEDAANIFDSFEGKIAPELRRSVYTGITEAMTNCHHHAYEGMNLCEDEQKWWLFSRELNENGTNELQVVFCDLGVGIPRSLYQDSEQIDESWMSCLKSWLAEQVKPGQQADDALKIKAAVAIGKSRTKKIHRGKGLRQMVGVLDELGNNKSKVQIFSGCGVYRRMPIKGQLTEWTHALAADKKAGICGTLIYWSIPLSGKEYQ